MTNYNLPEYKDIMELMHILDDKWCNLKNIGNFTIQFDKKRKLIFNVTKNSMNIFIDFFPMSAISFVNCSLDYKISGYCTGTSLVLHKDDSIIVMDDMTYYFESDQYLYEEEFNFLSEIEIQDDYFRKVIQTHAALLREEFKFFNAYDISMKNLYYYSATPKMIIDALKNSEVLC